MINKILEYQAVDQELMKIEDEINKSEDRRKAKQAQTYLKEAEENLQKMDKTAAELFAAFKKVSAGYEAEKLQMAEYNENVESAEDVGELSYLNKKLTKTSDNIASLEREMAGIVKKITELNVGFNEIKERVPKIKKIYIDSRQKFETLKKDKEDQVKQLNAKLVSLEKQNDPKLLSIYKRLRQENTVPAVVELERNSCRGCRMDIPMTAMGKIETEKYIICDSCGRIVHKA